jgi:hypothetical protein
VSGALVERQLVEQLVEGGARGEGLTWCCNLSMSIVASVDEHRRQRLARIIVAVVAARGGCSRPVPRWSRGH